MNVVPLGHSLNIDDFDCGDNDLNIFLSEDAFDFQEKRIANTFVLEDSGKIVAYFCLLNDKISRLEITNSRWCKIKDVHPTFRVMRQSCRAYSLRVKYRLSLNPYALRFITFILLLIPSTFPVEI